MPPLQRSAIMFESHQAYGEGQTFITSIAIPIPDHRTALRWSGGMLLPNLEIAKVEWSMADSLILTSP